MAAATSQSKDFNPFEKTNGRDIVTLCGSMKFFDQMLVVAREYTMRGYIVVMPHVDVAKMTEEELKIGGEPDLLKSGLDLLHLDKIKLSHFICVVMVDNYVGESTQMEISHAATLGKPVEFRNFPTNKRAHEELKSPFLTPPSMEDRYRTLKAPPLSASARAIKDDPQA